MASFPVPTTAFGDFDLMHEPNEPIEWGRMHDKDRRQLEIDMHAQLVQLARLREDVSSLVSYGELYNIR